MVIEELKDNAINAALKAGEYLLREKNSKKKVFLEKGRDIKLEIDRNAEKIIRDYLETTDIQILGEEFGGELKPDCMTWVIDPLDGTSNYFRGLDQCCVSIGLIKNEEPIVGVINDFNNGNLYVSSLGGGSYLNNKRIHVSNIKHKNKATIGTGFPTGSEFSNTINFLQTLGEWKKIRMIGSAAMSSAFVAAGKFDVYSEKGVYLWDFCAGACLVKEAGGVSKIKSLNDNYKYSVFLSNGLL